MEHQTKERRCTREIEFAVSAPDGIRGYVLACEDHVCDAITDPESQRVKRVRGVAGRCWWVGT